MPVEVILPKVDMDMETGVIIEWKVADGSHVQQGDILFDIETNKSVMEIESPGSGIIRELMPITGDPIAVGTAVAWIYTKDDAEPRPKGATPTTPAVPVGAAHVETARGAAAEASPAAPASAEPGEVRATPSARRLARGLSVDLATLIGSGPGGRIVEEDVTADAKRRQSATASPPGPPAAVTQGRLVPFNPIRRIVAERLAQSMREVPHFYLSAQIDMTALRDMQTRIEAEVVAAAGTGPSLTVLIAYIVGRVLVAHPNLNASAEGDGTRLHAGVHIGIAIDRNGDLLVPVLQDVHVRPLGALAREFKQLRDDALSGTIRPAQMRGGTFTLSNLGMYGVDAFTAIINPPECAILAVGRTVDTPVGRAGQIVLRPIATFTLSSDHRIVDGVTAARFMADLRNAIESPDIAI
jgi:pyruvate dehydrogenase E2 component (dihydrolipoamide acetyltransferase)